MSDVGSVDSVLLWMKSKDIVVPRDWVSACIEWISTENSSRVDIESMKRMVYEQWLFTDLRDFGVRLLPSSIADDKSTLTGNYCIQMNSIQDISQSKYSQILAKSGKKSEDVLVSATLPTQKPWEKKPARLLMMNVTDGIMDVSALEVRYIKSLNPNLPSGTKFRVRGPVKCRRGVIFLDAGSIDLLGGEVDEIVENDSSSGAVTSNIVVDDHQTSRNIHEPHETLNDRPICASSSSRPRKKLAVDISTINKSDMNSSHHDYSSAAVNCESRCVSQFSGSSVKNEQIRDTKLGTCSGTTRSSRAPAQTMLTDSSSRNGAMQAISQPLDFDDVSQNQSSHQTSHYDKANTVGSDKYMGMAHSSVGGTVSFEVATKKEDFKFLCAAKKYMKNKSHSKKLMVRVKAVVTTLLSKLKQQTDTGWSLKACICDGSDVLEVEFSDCVLSELIGIKAPSSDLSNPSLDAVKECKLKQGLLNCRNKIMSACHYMHVELQQSPSGVYGIVAKIESFT